MATYLSGRRERDIVDLFLPVSQAVAVATELDRGDAPYQIIPNFVPADLPARPNDIQTHIAQLPSGNFLLFVGDLSLDKGIGFLLEAYAGVPQAPPLVLIGRLVGDSPTNFPPNVLPMGPWPHEAVMEAWRRCIIGLVPSHVPEAFGLVALEAMAAGRPVIASRTGGLSTVVVDGETGLLVSPGDVLTLRAAIVQLLNSPELRQKMGQAGRDRVAQFRANVVVPKLEDAYRAVLAGETQLDQSVSLPKKPKIDETGHV